MRASLPNLNPAVTLERSQNLSRFRHLSGMSVRESPDSCASRLGSDFLSWLDGKEAVEWPPDRESEIG